MNVRTIDVICSDSRHKRGKIARVKSFADYGIGIGRNAQSNYDEVDLDEFRSPDGRRRHNYTCKLCGTSFVGREQTLHAALDAIAAQGVSSVELRLLNVIASTL